MRDEILIGDIKIPVKIIAETRMSHRFSIARKSAIVRLPKWYPSWQKKKTVSQFKDWVLKHYHATPHNFDRFKIKQYKTGDILSLVGVDYALDIENYDIAKPKAQVKSGEKKIYLKIPNQQDLADDIIVKLIKKIVVKAFKPQIEERLKYYASNIVKVKYKNFRLKDSVSNWGSCSGKDNINISIRTLLLPLDKIDYVLVHELCHLKEMNHSPNFWAHVESAMPNYKQADTWINKNGKNFRF